MVNQIIKIHTSGANPPNLLIVSAAEGLAVDVLELEPVELAEVEELEELEAVGVPLAGRLDNTASAEYTAVKPVTLVHIEGAAMVPAMKLTAAHYLFSAKDVT